MYKLIVALCAVLALGAIACAQEAPAPTAQPAATKPAAPAIVTVQGTVKSVTTVRQPSDVVYLVLTAAEGDLRVLLAPQAYLQEVGLTLAPGATVTVSGRHAGGKTPSFTAFDVTSADKTYKLRNARGGQLWSPYSGLPEVTYASAVKQIIVPAPKPVPEGQKPRPNNDPLAIRLETDKGLISVSLVPQSALDAFGIALKEGAAVSVTGWQRDLPKPKAAKGQQPVVDPTKPIAVVFARTLTIDGKTFELRSANGQYVRAPKPAPKK